MKFFTPEALNEWYATDDDEVLRGVFDRYTAHLKAMKEVLPARALELARLPDVDGALWVGGVLDHRLNRVNMRLRAGNLQSGYFNLNLWYYGAGMSADHEGVLAKVARSTVSAKLFDNDLAYHEVDVLEPGLFVHRLMFYSHVDRWRWFSIPFTELNWSREGRESRRLHKFDDRLTEIPAGD